MTVMTKDEALHAIEDLMDSSSIPTCDYIVKILKDNGDCIMDISRRDDNLKTPHISARG